MLDFSPLAQRYKDMMLSTKPEVLNVSQRRQRRTEPWPRITCTKNLVKIGRVVFSARCNIYISRLCYDVNVRLSVRLSVTEVHCGHDACREHSGCASQRSWSHHTIPNKHGRRRCCGCLGEASSRAMLATARPSYSSYVSGQRQRNKQTDRQKGILSTILRILLEAK